MLENNLAGLKFTVKAILYGFPFAWILISYWILYDNGISSGSIWASIVVGGLGYAFFLLRYTAQKRALENYIEALQTQQFNEAIDYGRSYYGMKRNGIKGAGGEGLTEKDEQAINNDMNAYRTTKTRKAR